MRVVRFHCEQQRSLRELVCQADGLRRELSRKRNPLALLCQALLLLGQLSLLLRLAAPDLGRLSLFLCLVPLSLSLTGLYRIAPLLLGIARVQDRAACSYNGRGRQNHERGARGPRDHFGS